MRFYERCRTWSSGLIHRGLQRSDGDERSDAMLHNHDFEHRSSNSFSDLENYSNEDADRARAPRGMLIGIGIALGLWALTVLAVLALR